MAALVILGTGVFVTGVFAENGSEAVSPPEPSVSFISAVWSAVCVDAIEDELGLTWLEAWDSNDVDPRCVLHSRTIREFLILPKTPDGLRFLDSYSLAGFEVAWEHD